MQPALLQRPGLKILCIIAEQQHKDITLPILMRPPQGKGVAWDRRWPPFQGSVPHAGCLLQKKSAFKMPFCMV